MSFRTDTINTLVFPVFLFSPNPSLESQLAKNEEEKNEKTKEID